MKFIIILFSLTVFNVSFSNCIVYSGTICGWAESDTTKSILCNGFDPRHSCPSGHSQQVMKDGWAYCYRRNTTTLPENAISGTICGGIRRALCGGLNPHVNCPDGYSLSYRFICYKSDPKVENAGVGQTCNGLPVGTCPSGFYPINDDEGNWHICFKHA